MADHYHICESLRKPGDEGYPENDGRYEMKIFKGFGFGNDEDAPTPVVYEKRKHDKRGLTYQELADEIDAPAPPVQPKREPDRPPKLSKKERRAEKERILAQELQRSISRDENVTIAKPFLTASEPISEPQPEPERVTSPRQTRAARAMSPPPPPNPRTDIPTSPSHKRAMSPPPAPRTKPKTKTPLSPAPPPRGKEALSPRTPRKKSATPRGHNTLPNPASSSERTEPSETVTTPTGYHYPTLPPGGYYPPHPGGYPPVAQSPGYPVYPYPAYPAYPPQPQAPSLPDNSPSPQPAPMQPAPFHMPYHYPPHPGYYPPHPGYPPAPTTPGVSQSVHQSQL